MTCLCWPAAHHFAILWASVGNTVPATFWALYYLINQQEALQAVRNELHQVLQLPEAQGPQLPEAQGPQQPEVMISKEQLDQLLFMGEFRLILASPVQSGGHWERPSTSMVLYWLVLCAVQYNPSCSAPQDTQYLNFNIFRKSI